MIASVAVAAAGVTDAPAWLVPAFGWTARTGVEACGIALLVLLVQFLLGDRISARWRCNLWLLVVARLVLPAVPSRFSPFNAVAAYWSDAHPVQVADVKPAKMHAPVTIPLTTLLHTPEPAPDAIGRFDPPASPTDEPTDVSASAGSTLTLLTPLETELDPLDSWEEVAAAESPRAVVRPRDASVLPRPPAETSISATPSQVFNPSLQIGASQTPATSREPGRPFDWRLTLAWLWLSGVAACLVRLALDAIRLSRKLRRMPVLQDPALLAVLTDAARTAGVRPIPRVLVAPDDCPPALVGVWRPRLMLSNAMRLSLSLGELRLVMLHELVHLKRRDVLANWVLAAVGALHWFNPVVHLTLRRMRADRELACDERVLQLSADSPAAPAHEGAAQQRYGQTIVNVLHVLSRRPGRSPAVTAVGVLDGKNFLRRRIIMIARLERSAGLGASRRRGMPLLGCVASVLVGAVALTGPVRGQTEPPVAQPTAENAAPATPAAGGLPSPAAEAAPAAPAELKAPPAAENPPVPTATSSAPAAENAPVPVATTAAPAAELPATPPAPVAPPAAGSGPAPLPPSAAPAGLPSAAPPAPVPVRPPGALPTPLTPPVAPGAPEALVAPPAVEPAPPLPATEPPPPALAPGVPGYPRQPRPAMQARAGARAESAYGASRGGGDPNDVDPDPRVIAPLEADISAAKAKLEVAKITADYKASEAGRAEQMAKAAQISTSEYEKIKAEAKIAAAQIQIAEAELVHAEVTLKAAQSRRPAPAAMRSGGYPPLVARVGATRRPEQTSSAAPAAMGTVTSEVPIEAQQPPVVRGARTTPRVETPADREADERATEQLRKSVSMSFDGMPLSEALNAIADSAGVTVFADWGRLSEVSVERDTNVSIKLRDPLPAEQVLGLVLRSAGGDRLGFAVDRGVIVIDSVEGIRRTIVTRSYDVSDLRDKDGDVSQAVGSAVEVQSIRIFGDKLIVSANEPTHREVAKFLAMLRSGGGSKKTAAEKPGRGPSSRADDAAAPKTGYDALKQRLSARRLWETKYEPRVVHQDNGQPLNLESLQKEYEAELAPKTSPGSQ